MKNNTLKCVKFKNWISVLSILIGFACIYFLADCTNSPGITATSTPAVPSVTYIGQGVAIGIREFPDSPVWRTYQVDSNSSFTAYLRLLNQKSAETYSFSCLIDYKQIPCSFEDHEEMTALYSINFAENEDRLIKFKTPKLSNGFHDFAILTFASPEKHSLDNQYRLSTDLKYFYAPRVVLHVGPPPYSPMAIDFRIGEARKNFEATNNGVVVNTIPDSNTMPAWFSQDVKPGEILDYYIHLANDTGPNQTYVVMSFLDFLQIPISTNVDVDYVALKTGERIEIPAQLTAPVEKGVHELMVIIARQPFKPLETPEKGNQRDLIRGNFDIENSIRIGIVVQESSQ